MSAALSESVLKRENASQSANVLMCKQWWKVCWMYGDQEKYYRQLYGKRIKNDCLNKKYDSRKCDDSEEVVKLYENAPVRRTDSAINATPFHGLVCRREEECSPIESIPNLSGVEFTELNRSDE